MTITAIIPTYCRYPYLRDLLQDLAAQTRPVDEIIVVDQAEPDERDEALYSGFDGVVPLKVLYLTEMRGTCVPRNLAITQACGDYLLFLDDDLRVEPDFLARYAEIAAQGYDVVHGGVRHRDNPLFETRLFFDDPVQQLISSPNTTQAGGTLGVASGNSLVKRSWVERIGGFDAQFDSGMCDDWDFGVQLFRGGARMIYHPAPAARHLKAPGGGRRHFFIQGWKRWLGGFRDYSPGWLAPRFYFYAKYFSPRAVSRLRFMLLREIFSLRYRLFRYPWAVPLAVAWWFVARRRAAAMTRQGPKTLGSYRQPAFDSWSSAAWTKLWQEESVARQ